MSRKDENSDDSSAESNTSSVAAAKEEDARSKLQSILRTYDQRDEQSIELADLGNVFRCMRINISQAEMYEIESQLVKENNNTIRFAYLIPRLLSAIQDRKYKPFDAATMELAFESLEAYADAPLNRDRLQTFMCSRGEPLGDGEFRDMLSHVAIRRSGVVDWRSYIRDVIEAVTKERV